MAIERDRDLIRFHVDGLGVASDDFADFVDKHGPDGIILDAFDTDDLVAQYLADRNLVAVKVRSAHALAEKEVAAYVDREERAKRLRARFSKSLEDDELPTDRADLEKAYAAWKVGYTESMATTLADHILDAYVEQFGDYENEEEDDELHDNLAGADRDRPTNLGDYRKTGEQDAGNVFDPDTLESLDIDLDDYTDEGFDDEANIDPKLVRTTAAKVTKIFRQKLKEDHEADWIETNQRAISEEGDPGMLPSEAFEAWLDGYTSVAKGHIAKWLEEDARAEQDD